MIYNYLLSLLRGFSKRRFFPLLNVLGFSLALAFSMLVLLFIVDEQSFEKIHVNKDRIYRINNKSFSAQAFQNGEADPYTYYAQHSNALLEALHNEVPEVEKASQIKSGYPVPVRHGSIVVNRTVSYADSSFFKIFSFSVAHGSSHKLFTTAAEAVISPQTAALFFGDTDPIGKELHLDNDQLLTPTFLVKAVIDFPANSSFPNEIVLPLEAYKPYQNKNWNINSFATFVLLRPDADVTQFSEHVQKIKKDNSVEYTKYMRDTYAIPEDVEVSATSLTALTDIHFEKKISWSRLSDPIYSWILGGIALLILSIASINYISFALMSATARGKEIGIRKSIGATATEVFRQFTWESLAQAWVAGILGIGIAILVLPGFNHVTQKQISMDTVNPVAMLGAFGLLVTLVGMSAAVYPSLIIARIRPIASLRGSAGTRPRYFMKPLVVLQFAMSSFLMIASVIMYQQMRFITTRNLGYQSENIVSVPTNLGWNENSDLAIERYRSQTQHDPHILGVSGSSGTFIGKGMSMSKEHKGQQKTINLCRVDHEYLSLLKIELVAGENFNEHMTDSTAVLVNETLVRELEWEDPLQERLKLSDEPSDPGFTVIGVMKDYNFHSLEQEVEPMVITAGTYLGSHMITLLIKLDGENLPTALESAEKAWKKLYPDKPFEFTFADQQVAEQYAGYQRWMAITAAATSMAIIIAGLGLFGLAGMYTLNRIREMSIRKVLGATPKTIFISLNKPFVILSAIAFVLAAPSAWYIMNKWIDNFQYHITIGWITFALSFVCAISITVSIVSYFAIRLSRVNPAHTLKSE